MAYGSPCDSSTGDRSTSACDCNTCDGDCSGGGDSDCGEAMLLIAAVVAVLLIFVGLVAAVV